MQVWKKALTGLSERTWAATQGEGAGGPGGQGVTITQEHSVRSREARHCASASWHLCAQFFAPAGAGTGSTGGPLSSFGPTDPARIGCVASGGTGRCTSLESSGGVAAGPITAAAEWGKRRETSLIRCVLAGAALDGQPVNVRAARRDGPGRRQWKALAEEPTVCSSSRRRRCRPDGAACSS